MSLFLSCHLKATVLIYLSILLDHFHDVLMDLKHGLEKWELVEFHEDGLGGYNAGNFYFTEYVDYYQKVVPPALYNFIDMLKAPKVGPFGHNSIWAEGNGKYCQYKKYFDYIHSMSKIHRCEVLHLKNYRCSSEDIKTFSFQAFKM